MKQVSILAALGYGLALASAGPAYAGAPQPDQRQGEFVHVCQGGPRKALTCTVATQDADCPRSACVLRTLSKRIPATLTIIAHDTVTDWSSSDTGNSALTILLELKAPDGSRQLLAATYQDLVTPSNPPEAPGNVVAIPMDELAVQNLSSAVSGLMFAQPEAALTQQLQQLYNSSGTPVIVGVSEHRVAAADHSGDGLATVLRFKVKLQFLEAV